MNTSTLKTLASICSALAVGLLSAQAQSGAWTNDASSVWSAATNWLSGTIANGTDATADFSTVNISTNRTVTLDSSRHIGNLVFGNSTTATNWTLNASGGSVLTLAVSSGSPTVAVTNIAGVLAPLAGTAGLTKSGNGTLVLGGTNSYSGATAVNLGTLQLTNIVSTNVVTFPITPAPVCYMSFDNVSNTTVFNQGSGGSTMNGTLQGTASIAPGMGVFGNALSITAGAAPGGNVLINNAVATMNVTPTSSWTVGMWLKSMTPGGNYFYQGNGGWASANSKLFLIQNAFDNDGNGAHAGGVSFGRSWEQGTAVVADGNWHFVVMTCSNGIISQYVDGSQDALVENQWNGSAGTTTQVRIGGSPTTSDGEIGLNGFIDEFYMFTNSLTQAQIQTLMTFSSLSNGPQGSLPLPATTAASVAAPATLDVNGNSAGIAGLGGAGTVTTRAAAGIATLIVSNTGSAVFNGTLTNGVGTLSLLKAGPGGLTLGGTNSYSGITTVNGGTLTISGLSLNNGATIVNGGTLNITGSIEPATTAAASSYMVVANGVADFSGAFLTNFNFNIGSVTNGAGAFYQMAGVLKESQGANGSALQLGSAAGGYGYYYIGAGASLITGEIGVGGEVQPSGNGVMDVNGGTVNDTGYLVIARNGTGTGQSLVPQTGVLNVYSGTLNVGTINGAGLQCNWGSAGTSIINVLGGLVSVTGNLTINLNNTGNSGNSGTLNLDGGVAQCGWVSGGANNTYVNFNGGTLAADENQTVMITGLTAATVFSGGGTFNNNGFTDTIGQQLLAPTGNGVNSIASFTGGAGYIAPPIVTVVGDGIGATAIAQIDSSTGGATSGQVTNIVITCPGVNYSSVPTFVLTGGGATTPATITGATPTANAGGGMTFTGAGTTALTGGYTYTGVTRVFGGTLNLTPSTITPGIAGDLVLSNATLNLPSAGVTLPVGNLNLQVSNTLNIAYGTVFANPTVAAINASGGITPAPTNIINITAFGLKPGTFTVIKYSTGTLSPANFANFAVTLPPGLIGTLFNNTGNDSIDLTITSSPNQLTWSGVNGTSWDTVTFNWTNNATGLAAVYQQYTNAGVIAGDGVTFDDTLTNDFVDPQPTNINITTIYNPFPVTVNSTLPYSIAGAGGIAGVGNIVKNNTGSLTLLTSNGFTGGLAINSGLVIVTNDFSLGASTGVVTLNSGTLQVNNTTTNNSRVLSVTANSTIDIPANVTARFGGAVTGAGGLTKTDNGTLMLAGTNGITGALTVSQGTLITAGNNTLPSVVSVGNVGGLNGVLNISGGIFNAINNASQFTSGLIAGSAGGSAGDIRLGSGTLSVLEQFGLGGGAGGYGGFTMSGGTLIAGSFIVVGFNTDLAVFNQSAGSTTVTTNLMTIGAGGTASVGVANFSGGTYLSTNSAVGNNTTRGGLFVGENGNGTLNVSGSATITVGGQTNLTLARQAGSVGAVNLNGGTIVTPAVAKGAGSATFDFNGGTLKAASANPVFLSGLNNAFVYNGGVTIDDGGFAITIPQPLIGATGFGVATIPLTSGGSGYIDTPIVTISGGNGSNAMATATVSGGAVTAVTVTCPGGGYLSGDSLSVSFTGGGASPTQPTVGTITFIANGTGGFTKKGAGTTTLTGASTFTGPLAVNGGTLAINNATPIVGSTTVTNGATLAISQITTNTESLGNLTLGVTTVPAATLSVALANGNTAAPFLTSGTLTVNGSNNVALAGRFTVGTFPLLKYSGVIAGTGSLTNVSLPQGVSGYISNNAPNSTIYTVITSTGPGLVWTGTNSNPALTNVWDIGSTTNWVLGTTPTTYQQSVPPGDPVTFNDIGDGLVTISNTISPFSMLVSNNAVNYTFQGPGHLSGTTGLTKLGSGSAILNVTNNSYTGDTIISNGVLQAGSASAVDGNLNIGPLGTLELAGFSATVNGLAGSGVIDDNSANSPVLTFGSGGSGVWSGTMHDQGLGGGVSFIMTGTNTEIFNGSNYLSSGNASQVNAGTLILTNNGVISCGNSEFWIAQGAGSTGTVVVASGTLVTSNNWLVIGRASATANGTLIVNGGTVQKAGANNIVLGSLGGTGTLIVNGGQVLNNGELWLGESTSGNAAFYLNGGLVQAIDINESSNGGLPTSPGIAYFNGGTLQASASSANFFQQCFFLVMSNGLVLDDNGFTLSSGSDALMSGDSFNGGLIKKGSGIVYLDSGAQYTGPTVVTNGTLAGAGSVNGPLVVAPAGNLGAGDAGATVGSFTVNNNLTLQGNATLRINKTGGSPSQDQVIVAGNITYGGLLTVTNITSDANVLTTSDSFQLFNVSGTHTGNFSAIAGSPGAGLAYSFDPSSGILSIITQTIAPNPVPIAFHASGNMLTLSWPPDHLGWILQAQTNSLAVGLSPAAGNWFDIPGSSSNTNSVITINPGNPTVFYRLRHP